MQYQISWPTLDDMINTSFHPLWENEDRYLILYGGRGSGKSDFVVKKLIRRCLMEENFRCLCVRQTYASIPESCFRTLKDAITAMGLEKLFTFKTSPHEIECVNGNRFIFRGLDDPTKIKSVAGIVAAWWEEDLPSEGDFITVSASIRDPRAPYLQEIFSINPEVEGDFHEHWFWRRFFDGQSELSFSGTTRLSEDQGPELRYTVHHSTYKDNRWLPAAFGAAMEDLKRTNPYYHLVYSQGMWGSRESGSRLYKAFDPARNVAATEYDPTLPLWTSWDFNVMPGCSCLIAQVKGGVLHIIDEIQLRPPLNRTIDVAGEVVRRYRGHVSGCFVTGDPSGRQEDTRTEKGYNDFTLIAKGLAPLLPQMRYSKAAPNVVGRINFANELFAKAEKIVIGECCRLLISDLLNGPEAADGTKLKLRVRDRMTGQSWERYHHFSDSFDYIVSTIFGGEYLDFLRGGRRAKIILGKNVRNPKWDYPDGKNRYMPSETYPKTKNHY